MLAVQGDGQSKQENFFYFLVVQPVYLLQLLVAIWHILHWVPTDSLSSLDHGCPKGWVYLRFLLHPCVHSSGSPLQMAARALEPGPGPLGICPDFPLRAQAAIAHLMV